jgi:cobalt-zinc-cadmium resistance protein CzcA
VALSGIAIQYGIIMFERVHELEEEQPDMNKREAVWDAALTRLRPILMTSMMAALGLLPAALSHAVGAETARPFAVVIVGGLAAATPLTLLVLPVAMSYLVRRPKDPSVHSPA